MEAVSAVLRAKRALAADGDVRTLREAVARQDPAVVVGGIRACPAGDLKASEFFRLPAFANLNG